MAIVKAASLKHAIELAKTRSPDITGLDLSHLYYIENDLEELNNLVSALNENATIATLNLGFLDIKDAGAKTLSRNTTIKTLNLSGNKIGPDGAQALAENTTITTLNLKHNNIGPDGAKALAENTTIETLDLDYNEIGPDGAKALAENTTITNLNLNRNNIGNVGAQAFAENTTITTLNLAANNIEGVGAQALAKNTTITTLDLAGNNIGDVGAQAFAENTTITTLDLAVNNIRDVGAQAFAENTTITTLNLYYNQIGPDGAKAFLKNKTITTLDLPDTKYTADLKEKIAANKLAIEKFHKKVSDQLGKAGEERELFFKTEFFRKLREMPTLLQILKDEDEAVYKTVAKEIISKLVESYILIHSPEKKDVDLLTPLTGYFELVGNASNLTPRYLKQLLLDNPRIEEIYEAEAEAVAVAKAVAEGKIIKSRSDLFLERLNKGRVPQSANGETSLWNKISLTGLQSLLQRFLFDEDLQEEKLLKRLRLVTKVNTEDRIFGIQSKENFRAIIKSVVEENRKNPEKNNACDIVEKFFNELVVEKAMMPEAVVKEEGPSASVESASFNSVAKTAAKTHKPDQVESPNLDSFSSVRQ